MQFEPMILTNALLLGLRHGMDVDHLAAISDIVGTNTFTSSDKREALKLSTCYILGHAAVVMVLGATVIFAGNFVPPWWESVAEKCVGITLVGLGSWLLFNACRRQTDGAGAPSLHLRGGPLVRPHGHENTYGTKTSTIVGMIHGLGAETGSQMLLLASVGGAANVSFAFFLLAAFVTGLLFSNSAIAVAGIVGFTTTARFRRLLLIVGCLTSIFSIAFGISLLR